MGPSGLAVPTARHGTVQHARLAHTRSGGGGGGGAGGDAPKSTLYLNSSAAGSMLATLMDRCVAAPCSCIILQNVDCGAHHAKSSKSGKSSKSSKSATNKGRHGHGNATGGGG